MKLSKALKEKKRLGGEIAQLKNTIRNKNSYLKGANVNEKFNVPEIYNELMDSVQNLVNLKIAINEGNKEIQASIYMLGEYKSMISFIDGIHVLDGLQPMDYGQTENMEYETQFDELQLNKMRKIFQNKADHLQDEIDAHNYTTDIPWEQISEEVKTEK